MRFSECSEVYLIFIIFFLVDDVDFVGVDDLWLFASFFLDVGVGTLASRFCAW